MKDNEQITNEEKVESHKKIVEKQLEDKMCQNPFLFISDNDDCSLLVIEDFYIKYKDEYIKFENVIRFDEFTIAEKKKIIKSQVALWKKSAEKEIYKTLKESKETILRCNKNELSSLSFRYLIQLSLGIIIPIVLFLKIIPGIGLDSQYHVIAAIAMIVLSVIGIVFTIIQNGLKRKFAKCLAKHKKLHNKVKKPIKRKLSKNCNYVKKYYLKNLKNDMFMHDAIDLEEINYVGNKLSLIKSSTATLEEQYLRLALKKHKGAFYIFAVLIAYLVPLLGVGYVLYKLVLNLIQRLF